MNQSRPTYQELVERLAIAEPIVEALKRHEVDAVVGEEKIAFLLLREVREELVSSDAAFRAMFELPGIGMAQAGTPDFRFARVNRKFCEMTGYSAEELLTKTFISLTDPRDRRLAMKELARVLRGKTDSWSIENRCVRKDGSILWIGVHGSALRDDTGRAVRIMAMISDLTARKVAEEKLRHAEQELKKRVKKAAVKQTRKSAEVKSSERPQPRRR